MKDQSLFSLFGDMPDPRLNRKRLHNLGDIITIAILSVICGADTWVDMEDYGEANYEWLKSFLELPNGIPSHDTFNRVFSLLSAKEFEKRFIYWVEITSERIQEHIAIDGKVLKGSGNNRKNKEPIWIVSAWAAEAELVLAHTQVSSKSNEITAVPKLLEILNLKGCIVSLDAMGCQKEIAKQLYENKADYILALKGNQGNLHSEVVNFFDQAEAIDFEYTQYDFHESCEKNRGREEKRTLYVTDEIDWLPMKNQWQGLNSIICLVSVRKENGKETTERRYYISSLQPNAQNHVKFIRNHWGIENKQHWVLDVGFSEDKSQIRNRIAGQNFATLRRLALNLLKKEESKAGMKRKRKRAGWDLKYLLKVIG